MSETPIDFRLQAEVNGESFEMNGTGVGNIDDGTCVLHLAASPRFPQGFDPVSCPRICSHPTSSYFSRAIAGESWRELSGGAASITPPRVGRVYDSKGMELLRLEVSGHVEVIDGVLRSYHQMRGFSHLPRLAGNVVTGDDFLVPAGPGAALGTVAFGLLTEDGEQLRGYCEIPYTLKDQQRIIPVLARTTEELRVDWDGGSEVSAWYRTSIRALTDIHCLATSDSLT